MYYIYFISIFSFVVIIRGFFNKDKSTWRKMIDIPAQFFVLLGFIGFFGSIISSVTELNLSEGTEWPIESSNDALIHVSGDYIVPHWQVGRIQIYDNNKNFIRGWNVQAGGGIFNVNPNDNESFYVYTARGNRKYQYDIKGNLISSEEYKGKYPQDSNQLTTFEKRVPWYLKPVTSPMSAFYLIFFGMLIQYFTQQISGWISSKLKNKKAT